MSHLTTEQRYTISVMFAQGESQKNIAETIGKNKSVISREISRNRDLRSREYRFDLAVKKAKARQENKEKSIRFSIEMKVRVENLLRLDYSPEQVKGFCEVEGLACVSHERIYQHIWEDKKKGGDLYEHLRRKGRKYRKRGNKKDTRGIIKDRVGIEKRPAIVDDKIRFGDFEADTIIGKNHKGAIVTVSDRVSGVFKMKKVKYRTAELVEAALIELLTPWKPFLKTITFDNGKEFANHKKIAKALDINAFFARPYHSWERGANENLNGLVRQYIPKKTDFESITDDYVLEVQGIINNRPRKRLEYKNPIFAMKELLKIEKVAFIT